MSTTIPAPSEADLIDSKLQEHQDAESEARRSAAFSSVPFHWRGKELAPFAISRESFWHQHRHALHCPAHFELMGDFYAFQADTARILFFVSHDPEVWLQLLADAPRGRMVPNTQQLKFGKDVPPALWQPLNPHVALEQAIQAWWEKIMSDGDAKDLRAAYELVIDIWERSRATRAIAKKTVDDDEEEEDLGKARGL